MSGLRLVSRSASFPPGRRNGRKAALCGCVSSTRRRAVRQPGTGGSRQQPERAGGDAKSCTIVAALVDTNVLVSRFDPRFPDKQARATEVLRRGIVDGSVRVAHQAILEFVAAVTRPLPDKTSLLSRDEAIREAEELLTQLDVLYPTAEVVRLALRGMAAYQLPWFDAHMWAVAEHFGLDVLLSEDFQDGRQYGTVRVTNPFR